MKDPYTSTGPNLNLVTSYQPGASCIQKKQWAFTFTWSGQIRILYFTNLGFGEIAGDPFSLTIHHLGWKLVWGLPKPNRKGSSSNHYFSGVNSLLNFGGYMILNQPTASSVTLGPLIRHRGTWHLFCAPHFLSWRLSTLLRKDLVKKKMHQCIHLLDWIPRL